MKTQKLPLLIVRPLVVSVSLLMASVGGLLAQTDAGETEAAELDNRAASDEPAVISRMSSSFSTFAGSDANARALVTGLHSGSDVTLTTTNADGTPSTSTTFTPKTGKMGYGSTYIALALAQESLTQAGVTNPTNADRQAALNGGTVTTGTGDTARTVTLAGVLTQRAEGKGWGQIAQSYNVKLGRVMSDLRRDMRPPDRGGRPTDKPETPGRPDRPEKPDRPERPERPEKPLRP